MSISLSGFRDYIVTPEFSYAERMSATTISDIQEGRSPLYASALIMFGGRCYIIRPHFHNQDLVSKPIAANLESGQELMINVPQSAQTQSVPETLQFRQSTEQKQCPAVVAQANNPPQKLQVVATSKGTTAAGQTIKVLKVVKTSGPTPFPAVGTSCSKPEGPIAHSTPRADYSQSGLVFWLR